MMSVLNQYFIHDDSVSDIQFYLRRKALIFIIENYKEDKKDYKQTTIVFTNISKLRCSNMDFIDNLNNNYGLEIASFELINFDKTSNIKLILNVDFGKPDVMITFTIPKDDYTIMQ